MQGWPLRGGRGLTRWARAAASRKGFERERAFPVLPIITPQWSAAAGKRVSHRRLWTYRVPAFPALRIKPNGLTDTSNLLLSCYFHPRRRQRDVVCKWAQCVYSRVHLHDRSNFARERRREKRRGEERRGEVKRGVACLRSISIESRSHFQDQWYHRLGASSRLWSHTGFRKASKCSPLSLSRLYFKFEVSATLSSRRVDSSTPSVAEKTIVWWRNRLTFVIAAYVGGFHRANGSTAWFLLHTKHTAASCECKGDTSNPARVTL